MIDTITAFFQCGLISQSKVRGPKYFEVKTFIQDGGIIWMV